MLKNTLINGLTIILLGLSTSLFSQNIAINTTGALGNASAILDLSNTGSYAFLPPQVALTNVSTLAPVPGPGPAGLVVYSTTAPAGGGGTGLYFWDGIKWNYLSTGGAGSAWNLTGNAATTPGTNFAGTSDPKDFVIKTNATERMRFMAAGSAGIGTATPKSAVDINGNMSLGAYAGVTAAPANGAIISGQVGIGTNAPNISAALDVTSTTTGFLPPRMTGAQMLAISTPAIGLIVLNTTTNCLEYWSGLAWQNIVCPCSGPPATPGIITGPATPCQSSAGNVYTIAAVPNATSYNWTVPAGASITANTGTSITVTFGTTSGNITVTASNSCGTSAASTLAITLGTPPAAPAVPSGTTSPLVSTANTYTIAIVAGATSYTWTTSNSTLATVTGGQGTTSATITSTATGGTYTICVYASNACGNSATSCLTVTSSACVVSHNTITFNPTNPNGPTGNIQNWTVPCGITSITITAYGASGGQGGTYGNSGLGAEIIGTLTVSAGNVLNVIVGQAGLGGSGPCYSSSGGGGSFVWNVTTGNSLLIAAAGGGGGAYNSVGGAGSASTVVTASTGSGCGTGGVGGNGGAGGGGTNNGNTSTGGGGCGWLSNGWNGTLVNMAGGGLDPLNGGTGGAVINAPGLAGGFGGGGGAVGNSGAGGGGGGYNGGGGGNQWSGSAWGSGGGGGSFNGGTAQTNIAGTRVGAGVVTIQY